MNLLSLMRLFTIRTRMIGAIAVVMALLALLGGVGLFGMLRIQGISDQFASQTLGDAMALGELRSGLGDLRRYEKDMIINYEKPDLVVQSRDQWRAAVGRSTGLIDRLAAAKDGTTAPLLAKMKAGLDAYVKASEPVIRQLEANGYDSATAANKMMARAKDEVQAVERGLAELQTVLAGAAKAAQARSDDAARTTLWLFGAALVVAIVVVVPLTLANMVSICRPIDRARHLAERIATGDLATAERDDGRDESAQLLAALESMRTALCDIVGQVRQSAGSIQTASLEVASGNADLSQRTEQAASNLQQTSGSMAQLTGTVRQSADAAATANQLASSAAQAAHRGGEVVEQVVANMAEISASSKRIADIIGVIDGIAFQTNILALNAAVEAARAGEQGRGFAVVAGEVRSLAGRSAEAAREIKSLIGASVERVESGSRLVQDAGATMREIVSGVQRVTDVIGEITAAAGEQSNGIQQVNGAVGQLDHMTQQNAALVEQSAAAAESLKEQAQRLVTAVGIFRMAHDHDGATAATPGALA